MSEGHECIVCGEHFQWGEIVVPVERVYSVGAQSGYVELTAKGYRAHLTCPTNPEGDHTMSTVLRIQFSEQPSPKTLAEILATAALDPSYEDSDILGEETP